MKIHSKDFRVTDGTKIDLRKWPTVVDPVFKSKDEYQELLTSHVGAASASSNNSSTHRNRHAVLLIFQAMDAAGKDGAIRHVMSGVNPQGCQVFSFKHPSPAELQHDFLWRTTRDLPERGRIGIFNRSYYEEVLIVRVHRDILASEGLPIHPKTTKNSGATAIVQSSIWSNICTKTEPVSSNSSSISPRMSKEGASWRASTTLEKNWKFSTADIEERKFWDEYMTAYEECLSATSTSASPWYSIPADNKENARLIISQIVLDTLDRMDMSYPKVSAERHQELLSIRDSLQK